MAGRVAATAWSKERSSLYLATTRFQESSAYAVSIGSLAPVTPAWRVSGLFLLTAYNRRGTPPQPQPQLAAC